MSDSVFVVLLERNPIQREGIVSFLRAGGFTSCVACSRLEELYRFKPTVQAKVLFLIDLDHAQVSMETTVKELHTHHAGCAVIVLVESCSAPIFTEVMKSEADGLLLKQIERDVLVKSLELVLLGERVFPAKSLLQLCQTMAADDTESDSANTQARLARLSAREREVLLCLEAGHSNKIIARTFGITESTVKVHVKAILRKIVAKNRTQAAVWAKRTGLRPPPVATASILESSPVTLHQASTIRNGAYLLNDHD